MNFDITKKFKIYFAQFITKKEEDNEKKTSLKDSLIPTKNEHFTKFLADMKFDLEKIYNYNTEVILNITILYYQYIGENNNIQKYILNTFKSLSGKVINKVDLKNIIKNIYKNDKKKEKEQKILLDIFKEIIPKYIDVFLIDCKVLCVSDELYNCKLETILSILRCFYISKIGENKCKIYLTKNIIEVLIMETHDEFLNEINYDENLEFNINENSEEYNILNEKNIDNSKKFPENMNQFNEKIYDNNVENRDSLFKIIFRLLNKIKEKFFLGKNIILDKEIPKSDDFKNFLKKAEMDIYLGINKDIKILIIILYYFYLGIKYNVCSKLFEKQEEIQKKFSLDKIYNEINNIIQNNNNNKIEYFAFICCDFPIINNEILEIKRFDTFRLDIEQLLQISILYYQYFLFYHYKKTYILNLENNNKII